MRYLKGILGKEKKVSYVKIESKFLSQFFSPRYTPRDTSMNSETYHYKRGANQQFSQVCHVFDPSLYSEEDLVYSFDREMLPIVIYCVAEEGEGECEEGRGDEGDGTGGRVDRENMMIIWYKRRKEKSGLKLYDMYLKIEFASAIVS